MIMSEKNFEKNDEKNETEEDVNYIEIFLP